MKKSKKIVIFAAGLVLLAAVAAVLLILKPWKVLEPYTVVKKVLDREKLSMSAKMEVSYQGESLQSECTLGIRNQDGLRICRIDLYGMELFYARGKVLLENGKAYRIGDTIPNYDGMLTQLASVLKGSDYTSGKSNGMTEWIFSLSGENAVKMIELMLPSVEGKLNGNQNMAIRVDIKGTKVRYVMVTAGGTTVDEDDYAVDLVLSDFGKDADFTLSGEMTQILYSGQADKLPEITGEMLAILSAWSDMESKAVLDAQLTLYVDIGPILINTDMQYHRQKEKGVDISWVEKNGGAVYFNQNGVVDWKGQPVGSEDREAIGSADLLSLVFTVSEASTIQARKEENRTVYSVTLPQETVETIVNTIVPEASRLSGLNFNRGKMLLTIENGKMTEMTFRCDGSYKLLVFSQQVEVECDFRFNNAKKQTLPDGVVDALAK